MLYDIEGNNISYDEWAEFMQLKSYKRIGRTKIPQTCKVISTVWVGLDSSFSNEKLIFETCVFDRHGVVNTFRCSTLEDAIRLHEDVVCCYRVSRRVYRKWHSLELEILGHAGLYR